jgi:hypothetical protein
MIGLSTFRDIHRCLRPPRPLPEKEGREFFPFGEEEGAKKLGKPISQKYLQSFTIAALWKVEVASISKQRIGLKFFILSTLPEKVAL